MSRFVATLAAASVFTGTAAQAQQQLRVTAIPDAVTPQGDAGLLA
jgi:hypothetical protein